MHRQAIIILGIGITLIFGCLILALLTGGLGAFMTLSTEVNTTPISRERVPQPIQQATPAATPLTPLTEDVPNSPTPSLEQAQSSRTETSPTAVSDSAQASPTPNSVQPAPQAAPQPTPTHSPNRLEIPRLGLNHPVVPAPIEGDSWQVSHLGQSLIGHLEGTAQVGSASNLVLAGHIALGRGIYGPFAGLSLLSAGDDVWVYEADRPYRYVIESSQLVDATAVEVTAPTERGQVTLITCSNWNDESSSYEKRLVVTGYLVN